MIADAQGTHEFVLALQQSAARSRIFSRHRGLADSGIAPKTEDAVLVGYVFQIIITALGVFKAFFCTLDEANATENHHFLPLKR